MHYIRVASVRQGRGGAVTERGVFMKCDGKVFRRRWDFRVQEMGFQVSARNMLGLKLPDALENGRKVFVASSAESHCKHFKYLPKSMEGPQKYLSTPRFDTKSCTHITSSNKKLYAKNKRTKSCFMAQVSSM